MAYLENLIVTPANFRSRRITRRLDIQPGKEVTLFDQDGPGCIRHWWLTFSQNGKKSFDKAEDLILTVKCDGIEEPLIEQPLQTFFGILLDETTYHVESHFLKVLPANGLNCYLPMPFADNLTLSIRNAGASLVNIWFMGNWHQYETCEGLTPLRLKTVHRVEKPATAYGSFLMADLEGPGLVAGMFKGIIPKDPTDAWFHTGGDTWMLDGETDPHLIRGIGVEDLFGYSFGLHESCSQWTGTPLLSKEPQGPDPTKVRTVVAYRFFGPDPVFFERSLLLWFGSKANDTETVVYSYIDPASNNAPASFPESWTLFGPFPCETMEDFQRHEFPEDPTNRANGCIEADFGQYAPPSGPKTFKPTVIQAKRTWVDLTPSFRTPRRSNVGTQPVDVSAYALATIDVPQECHKKLCLGFDDWAAVWFNSNLLGIFRHDHGFDTISLDLECRKGANEILIKLSNFDNVEWRAWAFSCKEDGKKS